MWCVRQTEILVDQQPPQGVFVCDHAGLAINNEGKMKRALGGVIRGRLGVPRFRAREAGAAELCSLGYDPFKAHNLNRRTVV